MLSHHCAPGRSFIALVDSRAASLPTVLLSLMSPPLYASHLPFAHEPWKTLYVAQRLTTTLLLVPIWATYYLLMPRSSRPRKSWSIKQIIAVRFTRRVHKVTEMAGVVWGTRDYTKEPKQSSLKETRFQWIEPLPKELRKGVVDDKEVPCARVGTFVWPKHSKRLTDHSHSTSRMLPLPLSCAHAQVVVHHKTPSCQSGVPKHQGHHLPAHPPNLRTSTSKLRVMSP